MVLAPVSLSAARQVVPQTLSGLTTNELSVDMRVDTKTAITPPQAMLGVHDVISSCTTNQYKRKASEAFQTLSECRPSHAYERFPVSRKIPILTPRLLFWLLGLFLAVREPLQADAKAALEDWYREQEMLDGRSGPTSHTPL